MDPTAAALLHHADRKCVERGRRVSLNSLLYLLFARDLGGRCGRSELQPRRSSIHRRDKTSEHLHSALTSALPPFRFIRPSLNCDDALSISTSPSFDHFWFHTELPRSVSSVSPVRCLDLTCHRERRRRRLSQICHRRPGILTGHDCWWGDYACWNCRAGFWNYISAFQKEWEREKRPCRQPITWE